MNKCKYVIVDSNGRYYLEISKKAYIVFTYDIDEATKMEYAEAEELIPIIEQLTGFVAVAEPIE